MQYFLASDVLYKRPRARSTPSSRTRESTRRRPPACSWPTRPAGSTRCRYRPRCRRSRAVLRRRMGRRPRDRRDDCQAGRRRADSRTPATISGGTSGAQINVQVSNGGSVDEKGVGVNFSLTGGPETIRDRHDRLDCGRLDPDGRAADQAGATQEHAADARGHREPGAGRAITTNNRFTSSSRSTSYPRSRARRRNRRLALAHRDVHHSREVLARRSAVPVEAAAGNEDAIADGRSLTG